MKRLRYQKMKMDILPTASGMHAACGEFLLRGETLGFVPTMGALHTGHLSLVQAAKAQCDRVAVSIFVNPTQFGPQEDLSRYPRPFEQDAQMLEEQGVDLLFHPSVDEMYPHGATTFVEVEDLSDRLDGKSRPGHFRGVATVVAKLLQIVQPTVACFGLKDAAQCAVIRRMVCDLHFDVRLVFCPTVREPDGLAMSSRNAYLSPLGRQQALVLYRSLQRVTELARNGTRDATSLIEAAREVLASEPEVKLDYFEIVDPATLESQAQLSGETLIAVAAYVSATRLIDNVLLPG